MCSNALCIHLLKCVDVIAGVLVMIIVTEMGCYLLSTCSMA